MPYKEFEIDGLGKIKIYKRKSNRSLRLSVTADGEVHLTMPLWTPYRLGLAFSQSKSGWISAQLNNRNTQHLVDGLKIGKSHHLVFRQDASGTVPRTIIRDTEVIVSYGPNQTLADSAVQDVAQTACLRALRLQSKTLLTQRLQQLALIHGFPYNHVTVKRLKGRWGSCDQHNNIVLNLYLVQLPWELIDYVILHELLHTKVLHHGATFWDELEKVEPKVKQWRKDIKQYRPTLLIA
jgi:predicted metal-dependent hydrolase